MATGNVPIFLPAIRNSLVVFCFAPKLFDQINKLIYIARFLIDYGNQRISKSIKK